MPSRLVRCVVALVASLAAARRAVAMEHVAAPAHVLQAALAEAGWHRTTPWCGPEGTPPELWAATWVMHRWGDDAPAVAEPEAAEVDGRPAFLRVRAHADIFHGLPVWQLEELRCAPEGACVPEARGEHPAAGDSELAAQLLSGLAVWHAQTPLGWPLIELRHAAAAIEALMAPASAAAGGAAASPAPLTCAPPLLPRPKPLLGPTADHILWRINGARRCVALTFDACSTFDWGPYNADVIDTLRRLRVPATLFIGGHWAELHPQEMASLAAEPLFELGNHTYSHPHMAEMDAGRVRQQVLWAQWAIFSRTGQLPSLLRLPYAEIDACTAERVAHLGMTLVEYDLPAGDADVHTSAERLSDWVNRRSYAGSIVIMHMNKPGNRTAEALPTILARLAARGLRPCTISAMRADGGA